MESMLSFAPLLGPASLLLVALQGAREPGLRPRGVIRAVHFASILGLVAAVLTAVVVGLQGPLTTPLLGWAGLGFALRLDALAAVMFGLVVLLGAVVLRFSLHYLDGDERQGAFLGGLALTIASVMLLVLSGNLLQLAVLWTTTSWALHRLLLFYGDRPAARSAARKKFIVARAGDLALALAVLLLVSVFGTGDLGTVLNAAREMGHGGVSGAGPAGIPWAVHSAALLVALSAALKSAQFPTHGWLAEVMETPTPVSALLHAGILNGGTFLVARLGEVALLSTPTLGFMVVVGGFTALFGSVVLVTQNSVKVSLAYSSAAHMGFMLMLCGLGAFPVAILHLVAHSFYKAHAFLSSGSAVESAQGALKGPGRPPRLVSVLAGMGLSVATVLGIGAILGVTLADRPVALGLSAILAIGLTQLWTRGLDDEPAPAVLLRVLAFAGATTLAFFTLEAGAAAILGGAVPVPETLPPTILALMGLVVALFAATVLAQLYLPATRGSARWAALHVHLRNGLYANVFFDRLVGSFRRPTTTQTHALETL